MDGKTLDHGFNLLTRLTGNATSVEALDGASRELVHDDPASAAALIFAVVVERSEDPDLGLLYEEWKRQKRGES